MVGSLGRRALGRGLVGAIATGPAGASAAEVAPAADAIGAIERRHGGRLGVFATETGSGRTLAHRADERFGLWSTFKGPLAAMVLARVDAGRDALGAPVRFGAADLLPASPVTTAHAAAGVMTVAALVAAILERSDNTAANVLMRRAGGPTVLTAWLRAIGDATTVVGRYEVIPGQTGPENTTTPRAIAATAAKISLGDVLRPATRALNNGWMARNSIGPERLRGGFPADWPGLDRTGTGDDLRADYAIMRPPAGAPIVIAAYYQRPDLAPGAGEAVLREVGAAVRRWAAK